MFFCFGKNGTWYTNGDPATTVQVYVSGTRFADVFGQPASINVFEPAVAFNRNQHFIELEREARIIELERALRRYMVGDARGMIPYDEVDGGEDVEEEEDRESRTPREGQVRPVHH